MSVAPVVQVLVHQGTKLISSSKDGCIKVCSAIMHSQHASMVSTARAGKLLCVLTATQAGSRVSGRHISTGMASAAHRESSRVGALSCT